MSWKYLLGPNVWGTRKRGWFSQDIISISQGSFPMAESKYPDFLFPIGQNFFVVVDVLGSRG